MAKRVPYSDLPFLPNLLAETVCYEPYSGQEWSVARRPGLSQIRKIETLRTGMSRSQISEFGLLCDNRCRAAYEAKAAWFEKIVNSKDGREELVVFIRHWMTAYLESPEQFRQKSKDPHAEIKVDPLLEQVLKRAEQEPGFYGLLLRALAAQYAKKTFRPEVLEAADNLPSLERQALGILIANQYADGSRGILGQVFGAALEDGNYHEEARTVRQWK